MICKLTVGHPSRERPFAYLIEPNVQPCRAEVSQLAFLPGAGYFRRVPWPAIRGNLYPTVFSVVSVRVLAALVEIGDVPVALISGHVLNSRPNCFCE